MAITCSWRGVFANAELNALHAEGFGHAADDHDWQRQVEGHSLGWVCARDESERLVGFANVPWDGAAHAFLLDVVVAPRARRHGVGRELVAVAADAARGAGCEWLHVDFEAHLRPFYEDACAFVPTAAGLIAL
jgi:GNAT superfamily N-acetyltransferase